jgi:hypothetical protein
MLVRLALPQFSLILQGRQRWKIRFFGPYGEHAKAYRSPRIRHTHVRELLESIRLGLWQKAVGKMPP